MHRFIIFIVVSFFYNSYSNAQSDVSDKQIQKEAKSFIALSEKQIKQERSLSDGLRARILELINELGYEEAQVIGDKRQYWEEGMSKKFNGVPKQHGVRYRSRNALTVELENKHVDLFDSDRRLLMWKSFANQCQEIAFNEDGKVLKKFKYSFQENLSIKESLLCFLASRVKSGKRYPHDVESLAEKDRIKGSNWSESTSDKSNKVRLDSIIEKALPYDGQVNFFIEEFVRDFGFILFKFGYYEILENNKFAIKWTDENGRELIEEAFYVPSSQALTFDIPRPFLKTGKIYRYEILSLDRKLNKKALCNQGVFDQIQLSALQDYIVPINLSGKVIYTAYFRTSNYKKFIQKIDFSDLEEPYLNDENKLVINFDEPFSPFELIGDNDFGPQLKMDVRMNSNLIYPEGLHSIRLKRLLTTPQDLAVDTLDRSETLETLMDKYKEIKAPGEKRYFEVDYLKKVNVDEVSFSGDSSFEITEHEFQYGVELKETYTYEISFPLLDSIAVSYERAQKELKERLKLRAEYFRLIDIKIKQRNNDASRLPIEHYLDLEYAKLSEKLTTFLDADMKLGNKSTCRFNLYYHLPALAQKTSIYDIKFDLSEKVE